MRELERRVPTHDDVVILLKYLDGCSGIQRRQDALAVRLVISSGLTSMDLIGLTVGHAFGATLGEVVSTPTGRNILYGYTSVHLLDSFVELRKDYGLPVDFGRPLITTLDDKPVSLRSLQSRIRNASDSAGIANPLDVNSLTNLYMVAKIAEEYAWAPDFL